MEIILSNIREEKITTSCLNYLNICTIKVTDDLQGRLQGQSFCARCYKGKHGKLYIIIKITYCRIQKQQFVFDFTLKATLTILIA